MNDSLSVNDTAPASEHLDRNLYAFGAGGPYDEGEFLRWQRQKLETIGAILERLPAKEHIADVGCYTGLAAPYYQRAGVRAIDGYDISEPALAVAAERGLQTRVWNCDGDACPCESHTYDVVIAADIIEHLINTDRFLQELHRILRPGGHLILSTPNLASWRNRLRLLRGKVPASYPGASATVSHDFWVDRNHIRVNLYSEWKALLEHHGFCVERVVGSTYMQILTGGPKTRLLKLLDRLALRIPTLATGLVIVASRP
ncbi:MAG TPA: class I SAM-dependent methyltransferase [Chloroflexota bacterium]|nr:class I SAM-dependent methyltransferase [Chloroflexota bacterium]